MSAPRRPYPGWETHPRRSAVRRDDGALKIASACLDACPRLTRMEMDAITGVFNTEVLISSQQSVVERILEDLDETHGRDHFSIPVCGYLKVLWKTCRRVFRVSPNVLLSVINHLQYGKQNTSTVKAIFSSEFSEVLSSLIVHPAWGHNYRKFRMALQFVVTCRIESRERWPPSRDILNHTIDCYTIELLRVRFDELEPGSVSDKLRQAIALTPFKEEFPAFLPTISDYVSQTATDGDINPSYRSHLAYPVETRDLKLIEQALDNYARANAGWRISTQRIWEAFKIERGRGMTELPNDDHIKDYILLALRQIYTYLAQASVSSTPSPQMGAEGTDESRLSSRNGDVDWDSSAVHDEEPLVPDDSPSLAAVPSGAPNTDGDPSDDEVLPTMSGTINSSSRQDSADNRAMGQSDARHNELRAIVEALQDRVQALERPREADHPSTAALIAENERLRRQRNALKALSRRQVREIQVLRQQRT
ncbi:uncharacterized protein B0J16DRAFT_386966 [Fusarium flagelliforme]|uniref:uncharacterized protein n=1 Tax=Fusarium flagelliforme TaxID=2675880 RepID=UPI001E8EB5C3|nr:uncharacterized protein B0J16DRAFT_386966 [Fusarium flagelliforme]KAH7179140.1 hypothetical protein B0J16DRAFT_386966 [Fusarium flagelliforme]